MKIMNRGLTSKFSVQGLERWGYKAPLLATPEEILEGLMS